jgi:glycosyltransferase involved in cell wall biosynthesis
LPTQPDLIPEVRPGDTMLLAQPGDPASLARMIALLAGDGRLREKLSTEAKQLGSLFEWAKIAEETEKLYRLMT